MKNKNINKKNKFVCLTLAMILVLSLYGCGTNTESKKEDTSIDNIDYFEIDANTFSHNITENQRFDDTKYYNRVTSESIKESEKEAEESDESSSDSLSSKLANLNITGSGSSDTYKESGDDIVANGTKFINLNNIINSIKGESKYSKKQLANFFSKAFSNGTESIEFQYIPEVKKKADGEIEDETIDDQLSDVDKYKLNKDKYKEKVKWMIVFSDNSSDKYNTMIGCNKYIMITTNDGADLKVNLNK